MRFFDLPVHFERLPGEIGAWSAAVDAETLLAFAVEVHGARGRLVALWASDERDRGAGFALCAALAWGPELAILRVPLPAEAPSYPDLSGIFPAAVRMQRAAFDLTGVAAEAEDRRPWLRHAGWPADLFPLRYDARADTPGPPATEAYGFVPVEGEGVHEIPVGPIHAGIIEPGHFRFSVVGEKVLRLEQRLGWVHKGIERRFRDFALADGHRLAGRVSGDSTLAYAWAYCQAAEAIAGVEVPPRAQWLRALLLERERVANHLGDLGSLGNDAALGFGLAQFMRLKEDWVRASHALTGHRFMMDRIVPGGVAIDPDPGALARLDPQCDALEAELRVLRRIYDEHAGVQDRFLTTGRLAPELAAQLGVTGLAGRASGQALDLRVARPTPPWDALEPRMCTSEDGDVAARVAVRFDEIAQSLRLVRDIARRVPPGAVRAAMPEAPPAGLGAGWVEGWRGDVFVALECEPGGRIRRCHCHDPSWQCWPALEHAVIGNIVPDFPLINKSFNLSYSGPDL